MVVLLFPGLTGRVFVCPFIAQNILCIYIKYISLPIVFIYFYVFDNKD